MLTFGEAFNVTAIRFGFLGELFKLSTACHGLALPHYEIEFDLGKIPFFSFDRCSEFSITQLY